MIIRYSHMQRTEKFSQQCSIIWPVLVNGWFFVYELSGCRFNPYCSHLNFRLRVASALSKEFLGIQATMQCEFTLRCVFGIIITYSQMHRTKNFSQHSSSIWSAGLNGWLLIYELNGCGFHSPCSYLSFRYSFVFSKKFLDVQATIASQVTVKCVCDMIIIYSWIYCIDKFSQHNSIILPVWLLLSVSIYKLSGGCFRSRYSNLNFKYRDGLEQGAHWCSVNYKVWI